jgi:hypothetical protein
VIRFPDINVNLNVTVSDAGSAALSRIEAQLGAILARLGILQQVEAQMVDLTADVQALQSSVTEIDTEGASILALVQGQAALLARLADEVAQDPAVQQALRDAAGVLHTRAVDFANAVLANTPSAGQPVDPGAGGGAGTGGAGDSGTGGAGAGDSGATGGGAVDTGTGTTPDLPPPDVTDGVTPDAAPGSSGQDTPAQRRARGGRA